MIPTRSIRIVLVTAVVLSSALTASAQTKGRIGVGGSVTLNNTTDSDVGTAVVVRAAGPHQSAPWLALCQRLQLVQRRSGQPGRWRRALRPIQHSPGDGRHRLHARPAEDAGQLLGRHGAVVQPGVLPATVSPTRPAARSRPRRASPSALASASRRRSRTRVGFTAFARLHGQSARGDLPEQHRPAGPGSLARRFDRVERRHGLFGLLIADSGQRSAGRRSARSAEAGSTHDR